MRALAKLKKTIKRRNKQRPNAPIHIINVPCMDLCPKAGVTICRPGISGARLSILRNEEEVKELCPGD
jgi:hypothetical protein